MKRLLKYFSIYCAILSPSLHADPTLVLSHHCESTNNAKAVLLEMEVYKAVVKNSLEHCVIRFYSPKPFENNECTCTIYSVHELQNGALIGAMSSVIQKNETELSLKTTYFNVDKETVNKAHKYYWDRIKQKKFDIDPTIYVPLEDGFTLGLDIRHGAKGSPMLRFAEYVYDDKKEDNKLYNYLRKASKNVVKFDPKEQTDKGK